MQQPIGEFIRQARRQHNFTQTELGGTRFSKSYISAVERNKIPFSSEALRYFAEQMGQPSDYFISLLQQVGNTTQLSVLNASGPLSTSNVTHMDDTMRLLDILLDSTELCNFPTRYEMPTLSPEVIAALPPHKQSRYYFLMGLVSQHKGEITSALHAFEYSLTLAPDTHRPTILDELGVNYYTAKLYQTALVYHQRALHLLQKEPQSTTAAGLLFKIELHCGDDYRALGAYRQAREHYEQARLSLNAEHDMKTAGLLYVELGFCTYFLIHQRTALTVPVSQRASFEEMEREFQRAVSFLLQGRSIYQVSGDRIGEASARLTLARVLLDFCTRQRQMAQDKAKAWGIQASANYTSLLNDAEEQCRQVLLGWQDASSFAGSSTETPTEVAVSMYLALAYRIRTAVQRAALARLDDYTDTAYRERAIASYLCQQVLDSVSEGALPWAVVHNAANLQSESIAYQEPALPRLPDLSHEHSALSHVEVYFAAGEVAEELGRIATSKDYCHDCYMRATQCFQAALDVAYSMRENDPSYFLSCYQRYACILEERMLAVPEMSFETAKLLSSALEYGLSQLQFLALPVSF